MDTEGKEVEKESCYENTNGMPMANGRNLHMNTGPGDMANLVVNVGSLGRAELISSLLEGCTRTDSSRGFTTFTGSYKGKRVSVVAIGMGVAMMDFFVRETRAVVSGPLVTIRFGTCGGVGLTPSAGSIVVVEQSGLLTRNPDAFVHRYGSEGSETSTPPPTESEAYRWSQLAPADGSLTDLLDENMRRILGGAGVSVTRGVNVTADSFYGSQGRIDDRFLDANASLIDETRKVYGATSGKDDSIQSMEMEAFQLLHLAKCADVKHPVYAAAAAIVVADRATSKVIDEETLKKLELEGGRAVLDTLTSATIKGL